MTHDLGQRPRLLVLGSSGFLGANIALASAVDCDTVLHSRAGVRSNISLKCFNADLTRFEEIVAVLDAAQPEIVVNCAALADVDECERHEELAFEMNAVMPGRVAAECERRGIRFVHVSSDAVFGGEPGPYEPATPVSPINIYGRSKAAGEEAVMEGSPRALVVRTNIVGWSPAGNRSLLEFFVNKLSNGECPPGFSDVHFRPISVELMWPLIWAWLQQPAGHGQLRHATGDCLISKFEFGCRVSEVFGFGSGRITPVSITTVGRIAARPRFLDVRPSPVPGNDDLRRLNQSLSGWLAELRVSADQGRRDLLRGFLQPSSVGTATWN